MFYDNIVIMHTRPVKKKGIFAFLKPSMVEITVGLEEESVSEFAPQDGVLHEV